MGILKEDLKDPDFIQKLIIFLDDQTGFKVAEYEEIEPGLAVILCKAGVYNIYFDKSRWVYKGISKRDAVDDSIGMIPGYKIIPEPKSFPEARVFIEKQFAKKPEP